MKKIHRGNITPALLVITSAFIIVIYGLLLILSLQFDFAQRQVALDRSLHIAEAGINYYRWLLSVDPDDFTDGTGQPGPYIHDYKDPQGDIIGSFSLEIDPPTDSFPVITITSTAWLNQFPRVKRSIQVQYGKITLTRYAFLHNSNMWFGNDIDVTGPVFSNGGIRQDGTNTSTIESAKQTYTCGIESGCTSPETKPGVWGNGEIDELWSFPVAAIDFDSIKVDFSDMKSNAQSVGLYLGPSGAQGYHLVFNDDGTVSVYTITGTSPLLGYSLEDGCQSLYQVIASETAYGTYNLSTTPIIFAEDHVWVEGVVNGKTTVAAAQFPLGTYGTNIWIRGDLTYLQKDGNHKLGLVAEKDIIFARDVPDEFDLHGALLAQNGRTIRHHYNYFGCRDQGVGQAAQKNEFNFYGSLISNQRSYWNFSSGPKSPASGFVKTTLDYDSTNYGEPPPYFPSHGGYNFLSWKEVRP
ncbi:hypothetical protein A3A75_02435 [Candidatus Woesebacteria bacterium RIFCSPLOWO2_01_FULL_39_10]|uniref:DUF4900 domain-containing protein n=1 Tax=Candidatus Woesebacteria bacterium RIFCSPLOWO2_01_FULL_39_10 TaxID=1802516 RepID=A0A1F8BA51_9BACT|nr:MAG: hypothetical protein A3A75_02435 [Candidatus Woesebacteria bacterium RIFCSPLOWO2_01_FULL_39_10]